VHLNYLTGLMLQTCVLKPRRFVLYFMLLVCCWDLALERDPKEFCRMQQL
jgi:hypothetical protein